jgi:hypothetical protein
MALTGKDIDMSRELSAKDNIRKSKIITVGSTFFCCNCVSCCLFDYR